MFCQPCFCISESIKEEIRQFSCLADRRTWLVCLLLLLLLLPLLRFLFPQGKLKDPALPAMSSWPSLLSFLPTLAGLAYLQWQRAPVSGNWVKALTRCSRRYWKESGRLVDIWSFSRILSFNHNLCFYTWIVYESKDIKNFMRVKIWAGLKLFLAGSKDKMNFLQNL